MKIQKWIDYFLYSNIFISLCAAAITAETYLLVHFPINWLYISFTFFSTMVFYGFPSLLFPKEAFSANQSERHKWIIENRKALVALSILAFVAVAINIFFFPVKFILWMTPNAIVAFAYFFPQTRLRSITGLKAAIVAFVWTMVTYVYPFLLDPLQSGGNWNGVAERFFYMLPLCIIFNVRDVEADRTAGVRTIPVVYGVRATIMICLFSLFLFSALAISDRGFSLETIALIISAIASGILILKASENRNDYFYSFWIDGMILLQAGLLFLLMFSHFPGN